MSDTAAFFAKKKTKKKKFKSFNANKIDASAVTTQTHVDAPEISAAEDVTTSLGGLSGLGGSSGAGGVEGIGSGDDQWADTQGAWGSNNNAATTNAAAGDSKVAELLDMQALKAKRNEQDDVRERLRIEETKAALAKAKEGMAKEAERLEAEKAEKEAKAAARASGMSGAGGGGPSAIGGGGGGGSKWVPSRMRSAGVGFGMGGSNIRGPASMDGSGGFQKPVDMANEELFPDLANADKILAEKEKQEKDEAERMAASQPVRAPTGWGSRMAPGGGGGVGGAPMARKPLNLAPPPAERKPLNLAPTKKKEDGSEAKEEKTEETIPAEATTPAESSAPAATVTPDVAATPAPETDKPKEKKVLKKKKKKDLSTFKPKS